MFSVRVVSNAVNPTEGVWGLTAPVGGLGANSPHASLFSFPPCCSRNADNREGLNLCFFYFQGGLGAEPPWLPFSLPSLLFAERGNREGLNLCFFVTAQDAGLHAQKSRIRLTPKKNSIPWTSSMGGENGKNRLGSRPLRSRDPSREKAAGRRPATRWGPRPQTP